MSKNRSLNAAKRAQAGQKKKSQQSTRQQLAARLGITAPLRPVVKALPKTSLRELLAQAKATLHEVLSSASLAAQPAPLRVFFSFSAGAERAQVVHFTARDTQHLEQKINTWQQRTFKKSPPVRWLRVDWVVSQQPTTWQALPAELARHKRNYFRYGIALDTEFNHAFLEQELNANAMLYPPGDTPQAGLNADHFLRYGQARFDKRFQLPQDPQQPLLLFTTEALLFQPEQAPIELHGYSRGSEGLDTGRRKIERLDAPQVENLIAQSSQFLAEQVNNKGRFVYGIHPCFDRDINTYNTLRHTSTTYAMLEAWEVTQSAELKSAIDRSLTFLTQELIRRYTLPTGEQVAYLQDENNEIKLGGNAVCLLALVKYTELTKDQSHLPLLEQLALGILNLQNPDTGQLTHVLNAHDLSVKETFRIIYYDGEAAFGLMRLYGLTQDPRWLDGVVKAFDYFIAQKHWQIHDHWLSYCVNELTLYRPEERYFQFGIQNVAGYLDFVIERLTTFPTLLELMMAAHKMITRLQTSDDPGCQQNRHLLKTLDLDKFYRALETRAHALLNGFFWPEQAIYFKNPQRILGSFFIRHHSFRVRIDDVEHYVSGYVAYLKHYLPEPYMPSGGQPAKLGTDPNRPSYFGSDPNSTNYSTPLLGAYTASGVLAWGGDVNLGRRQHYRSQQLGFDQTLVIPELKAADLTVVNLECVVSTLGEQGVIKGEGGPYYYRARPEMLQVLTEAGVNLVTVANNHSGDYGSDALMQQQQLLEAVGIASAGSGQDQQAAFTPTYSQAGEVKVAVFAIDATQHRFAATAERPGAAYLPPDQPAVWQETLAPRITQAKQQADLVVVAVHWGANQADQPDQNEIALGHAIIDAGADAILGASAHRLQGVEVYRNKPIIHDAGDLLFDSVRSDLADSGIFQLGLTQQGVSWVRFVPAGVGFGFTQRLSGTAGQQVIQRYAKKCQQLGTRLTQGEDDAYLLLDTAEPLAQPRLPQEKPRYTLEALHRFPVNEQQVTVEQVPEEAAIEPIELNGLTLLGVRVHPTHLTRRRMLWVETWWQATTPLTENLRLDYQAVPQTQHKMPVWGRGMDHDPCDWLKPTSTWQPGKIYRDFYGLRPPQMRSLINDTLQLQIRVLGSQAQSDPWIWPASIRLEMPNRNVNTLDRHYRTDFSGLDLSVPPGQTWSAKQLQEITGGQWLVPPPPSWFVRSVVNGKKHLPLRPAPTLFVAHTNQDRAFHEGSTQPIKGLGDRHLLLPEMAPDLAGALVSKPVQGLPSDFPLLKVDDPIKALMQLGFAARQRYQGPVIAITGTAGKSSTLGLIETLFDPGCYLKSVDNYNSRVGAPVQLASLAPDHQAAIIEIAQSALWMQRGPITRQVKPTIAILTEIGLSQTNRMVKTTQDVAQWKSRIFDGLTQDGIAILGEHLLHFDYVLEQAKQHAKQVLVFGASEQADLHIIEQRSQEQSTQLQLKINGQLIELQLPFTSQGMIHNALATLAVAHALGIDLNTAAQRMATRYVPEEGRMEEYKVELAGKQAMVIDDSWNAEVISMLNAFSALQQAPVSGRKIAVLGRIVHLGDQAAALHASLAEPLIATGVDLVLTHGDEMRYLREQLPPHLLGPHFSDAPSLFAELKQQIQPDDCILLKGSRRDSDFGDASKLLKENIYFDNNEPKNSQENNIELMRPILQNIQLMAQVTKGTWNNIEDKKFNNIESISYLPKNVDDNSMVVFKNKKMKDYGFSEAEIKKLDGKAVAVIGSSPPPKDINLPYLKVSAVISSLKEIACYARDGFAGKVVGITGSAGKSTLCDMLGLVLSHAHGSNSVLTTQKNENLQLGVATALARLTNKEKYAVLEIAAGHAEKCSLMARPDVVLFSNVSHVHASKYGTLEDIADRKSGIFKGVREDGLAVLCRDTPLFERVRKKALEQNLKLISYGFHEDSDFRVNRIDSDQKRVFIDFFGSSYDYEFSETASHFVLNSVGVAASLYALGEKWKNCIRYIEKWQPLSGRGNLVDLILPDSINVSIIDDSFNAAPIAMREALISFSKQKYSEGRKIVVLGEMLETGEYEKSIHKALAELIKHEASSIDIIYAKGDLYNEFWSLIPEEKKGGKFDDANLLEERLVSTLKSNDRVLFKGSHGSGIYKIAQSMTAKFSRSH